MKRSVRVIEVASRAGVSLGTVSNVLNHPERVAPATRKRVLRVIEELGFVRNEAARQLRAGRSRMIGLIVLDIANPFFTDVAAGVEQVAAEEGLSVILCNSDEDRTREEHYLNLLEEVRAYGILFTPVVSGNALTNQIRERSTPVVLVDRASARDQCSVSVDDVAGGEMATRHLLEHGHERLAFVGGPEAIKQVADRLKGMHAATRGAGLSDDAVTFVETEGLTVVDGRGAGQRIATMAARHRPTAAFCANDLLALGLLQEMTRRQVDVPSELAIVGYDDIEFASVAAVPLTSIRQPRAELGRAAAELLIDEVERASTHRHRQVLFAPELVVRSSSDRPVDARRRSSRKVSASAAQLASERGLAQP